MKFSNKREEYIKMIEGVALFVSLGAIFLQIWVLISAIESSFNGNVDKLLPSVFLSGLAFFACGIGIMLTNIKFFKGNREGRTFTYQNKDS